MPSSTMAPTIARAKLPMLQSLTPELPHSALPIHPPSTAPAMPKSMVMIHPPGSFPGIRSLAIAPAIKPKMIQPIMAPIVPPSEMLFGCWRERTAVRDGSNREFGNYCKLRNSSLESSAVTAAVHQDGLPGDVGRAIRGEPDDYVRELLWRTHALNGSIGCPVGKDLLFRD